jgi:hypothetical protein
VSIRQHRSAYVSIRGTAHLHQRVAASARRHTACYTSAYVSIRQHTSAYVSIRQHTSAHLHRRVAASARQHTACYTARTGLCPNSGIAVKATCQPPSLGDRASHCKKKIKKTKNSSVRLVVPPRAKVEASGDNKHFQSTEECCNRAATELQQSCNSSRRSSESGGEWG